MDEILLCLTSPPQFDYELFSHWVDGKSEEDVFQLKLEQFRKNNISYGLEFHRPTGILVIEQPDFIKFEITDQYRSFQILEHFVSQPLLLKNQSFCVIDASLQPILVEKYWSLDDIFVREVLNKRLTKTRKDLEDASETMGLNLRRITRQYENLKRVYNSFEDDSFTNIYAFLNQQFLLNDNIARKYSCIIFLLITKFNLLHKKLKKVSCENLENCAALILTFLSTDLNTFLKYFYQDLSGTYVSNYIGFFFFFFF
jgi:hypothetical protein